jgi:hypothetical protein
MVRIERIAVQGNNVGMAKSLESLEYVFMRSELSMKQTFNSAKQELTGN